MGRESSVHFRGVINFAHIAFPSIQRCCKSACNGPQFYRAANSWTSFQVASLNKLEIVLKDHLG